MNNLLETLKANALFALEFVGIIVGLLILAIILEKIAAKKNGESGKILTTRKMAMVGLFSALATILMLFELPVFFAPPFYKLDASELPILIGAYAFGPAAGVLMEAIKVLLNLVINGSSTAFVGELANFAVGCSLIIPSATVYTFVKNKKGAIWACIVGTLSMTVFGTAFNAIYLIPAFAKLFGMPIESIIGMGMAVNPLVKEGNLVSLVVACVAPLNLIKGTAVCVITMLVYKPLSPILKSGIKNHR